MDTTSGQTIIDQIQVAREDQSRAMFPTILNDVMVELGWTEHQAAEALDTTETTIQRWMAGRNIPTWSVCEAGYQHMIARIIEQETIDEMTRDWVQQHVSFNKEVAVVFGFIVIGVVVWLAFAS
jgi:DNA-binding XRE family transcriptional regulator